MDEVPDVDDAEIEGDSQSQTRTPASLSHHHPPSTNPDTADMATVAHHSNDQTTHDASHVVDSSEPGHHHQVINSSHQEMDGSHMTGNDESKSVAPQLALSARNNNDGPPRMGGVRPKSGKVLVRKNTPAMLPKVEKLYTKDKVPRDALCEEEEEEEEEKDNSSEARCIEQSPQATGGATQ